MTKDQWQRISPRTGQPVRRGNYKAGPGRGNCGIPARPPGLPPTEPPTPPPLTQAPPITSSVTAEDAHSLLKAIYNDTSLPLYARLDAARIAIRHESPTLTANKIQTTSSTDPAKMLEDGRKRVVRMAEEYSRQQTPYPAVNPGYAELESEE
jgi:DNA-directed RNA polymerase subunit L